MDLVTAARQGSEAAFLKLFDEHRVPLFRFAYRMTGSPADAEDIVQECFLQLLRPECSYDPAVTPIRTYLFGVVRNQSLKRLGNRMARPPERAAPPDASPESRVLRMELGEAVARAVMELPQGLREALILAHYEQMSIAEIARVMEIESTTVKSRLQRARAQLREALSAYAVGMEKR
ncbi:MAG TPA: RNA polymerase sigma factor [Bryobacteraceae bacterium]|jgi:RNA polymerase sigma-70 factor (ECF subfamily)